MVKKVLKCTFLVSKTQCVYSLQLGKCFKTEVHKSPVVKGTAVPTNFSSFLKNKYMY